MYKIIGADHREYGPCSADELRRWYREGRVNAQTLVQPVGGTDWKPLGSLPEFAPLLSGATPSGTPPTIGPTTAIPAAAASGPPPSIDDLLTRDYDLDIFGCLSRAWALLQRKFWPIIGISVLVGVAMGAINQVLQLFVLPIMGLQDAVSWQYFSDGQSIQSHLTPGFGVGVAILVLIEAPVKAVLMGGLYRYYLRLIRGEPAELADAFSGFSRAFVPLLLAGLVATILEIVGFAFCVIPCIYLSIAWIFTVPLVIDRQMDFWPAMELSRKVVSRHWFFVLGLVLVIGLVAASGLLLCCIGVFVTGALAQLSLMFAYEDIFGRRPAAAV